MDSYRQGAREGVDPSAEQIERRRVRGDLRSKLFGAPPDPVTIGRFSVRRRLGAGAMGVVYAAHDPQLQREVALKVLNGLALPVRDAFLHEARALARFSHPNVLQIHEAGLHEGVPFLVSELVDGGTLREWLAAAERPWRETLALLIAAGRGLQVAHQRGITHRDIKPENLLVGADGRPRLADFGLALSAGPGPLGADVIAGTLRYMAPEQRRGERVDPYSDQFGYCVMVFEALYGKLPHEGTTDAEILAAVEARRLTPVPARHPAAAALAPLRRGLSASPGGRYPSMAELLADLEKIAGRRRPPVALGLGAAALLVAGVVGAWAPAPPAAVVLPPQGQPPRSARPAQPRPADPFDPRNSPLRGPRICFDGCIEVAHSSREYYLSWADAKGGPTGAERNIRGVFSVSPLCAVCQQQMQVERMSGELAAASAALAAAAGRLVPVAAEAEAYYERGLYKTDKMAAGRRLHGPLLAAYDDVAGAARALRRAALAAEAAEQRALGSPLYGPARALLQAGVRDFSKIDQAALAAALAAYERALEGSPPGRSADTDLATAGRDLLLRLKRPLPFSPRDAAELGTHSGHTIAGSPDQLAEAYASVASHRDLLAPCRHYRSQPPE